MRRSALLILLLCTTVRTSAAGDPAPKPEARPRPNILLITIDSLRADRLGCYAGEARSTPVIDELAVRGVRFERAYAASPSTAPSSATILTGVYPIRHALRHDLGGHLAGGLPTLAAVLKAAGYRTGAVIGSFHLDVVRGLDRGFETYDGQIKGVLKHIASVSQERRADEVTQAALQFLDGSSKEKPFFLWANYFDPHYDYSPPKELAEKFKDDLYQGEVAFVDTQLGALVRGLKSRGFDGDTHIILAGSHGEGLGDHKETGHGIYLYETTIRVPLLVVPAGLPQGRSGVVRGPVGLVDLMPTILELADVRVPPGLDGRSLVPLVKGGSREPEARRYFIEAVQPHEAYGWSALYGVIDADRKVVQGQHLEAFNLKADPTEVSPLKPLPSWAGKLETYARGLLGTFDPPESLRREIEERARALDLPWEGSPICLEKQVWPDPRDRSELNQTLFEAGIDADHGTLGFAYQKANPVLLTSDPANFTALDVVVHLALRNRWVSMIEEPLGMMQCNYPWRGSPYHHLYHYFEQRRDFEKARKALEILARLDPLSDEAEYDFAAMCALQGMKEEAFEHLKKSIGLGATNFETIRRDGRFNSIHDDPRFAELVGSPPPAPGKSTPPPQSN